PSGGYLVFDYAEAFTVIDVNTGRFVGSRSKTSTQRLEDTITKNNLEAVKEVVRQLRLRDVGGIIVIDFIDMANPKNRAAIEASTRRRFLLEGVDAPTDHFEVLAEGTLEKLAPESPVSEGQELEVKLVEVGLHDPAAGVAKLDGCAILVGGAAKLVGKKVKVRIERAMDGVAYASLLTPATPKAPEPITAESMAEKPTRASRAKVPEKPAPTEEPVAEAEA